MDKQEFINKLTIDETGHYPFQMFSNKKDKTKEMSALAVNDIAIVFREAKKRINGADSLFFTADFPAAKKLGMNTDYIGIFSMENGFWKCEVLPYENEVFLPIAENSASEFHLKQFLNFIS